MTVSETLAALKTQKGIEPKASYTGTEDTDDFIFAVQTDSSSQTKESAWIVCADHVKEHSGALNASTNSDTFIRTGPTDTKSATQRTLSVNGNRCVGDAFQDFLLSHKIKYGTGSDVVVPYIYFSLRTGKGEKGKVAVVVQEDQTGDAGENAGFSVDLMGQGSPEEYTYSAD